MTRLFDAIARHAADRPQAIAIEGSDGIRLSWRALADALPSATASVVRDLAGGPIAVSLDQGPVSCLLDIAMLEAGAVAVPIARFFSRDQADRAMAAAGCSVNVTHAALNLDRNGLPVIEMIADFADPHPMGLPQGTAKVSFTSGSTGIPKGVCLSADHLLGVASAVVEHLGVEHAGRHLPILPPAVLLENVAGFYASILAGGTYVALSQSEVGLKSPFQPDFATMLDVIEKFEITSLILVPEYLSGLVRIMSATGRRLPRLTLVAVGGARVSPSLIVRALAVGLPVRQGYGLTECGSVVALERGDEPKPGSVGPSIGANRIAIADDGEVVIHGPGFLGTTTTHRPDGPIHTGDLGRFDENGNLWLEGRKSNLIVTSFGRNISPEWIESLLVDEPAVLQALVRGDARPTLDALVVPSSPDADVAGAVGAVNALLPDYARIATWQVVPPFTPLNGQLTGNGRMRRDVIATAHPERSADMPFFDRLVAETREAQARFAMVPQLQAGLTGRISRADYLAYLTQAFHHVRHTVPLMQAARARLSDKPMLVEALDEYIEEETGHEAWILDDIDAAGGDSGEVATSDPAPATARMVAHAYETIRTGNPAAFFGMVFVLEGTSIAMATSGASAVRNALGLPPEAFRYLTSHGALDQDHMKFFERLMNRVDDPADQEAIIAMADDMFRLFGGMFGSIALEASHAPA
jgi:long-subunit acyl-CoA synthetase (AMP-forming)/pyrroloquinoline quinone (PQQ) biosynthesis protein C